MNLAHLHLLLNHFPTVGTVIGLGLFLYALISRNEDLKRVSLGVFFVIALVTIPAYLSGNAAQEVIAERPGISQIMIERHQDAALLGLLLMQITGTFAWIGLWQFRRKARLANWNLAAVLLLSIVTVGLMANAANVGGEIGHPEIRPAQETTAAGETAASPAFLSSTWISTVVNEKPWVWPASETLHFIGLFIIFGVVLIVNLRMLGMMKSVSFAALHALIPLGIVGFGINLATGMLFFIATPQQYTQNPAFYWKIILMLLAGANVLYLTVFDETWALKAGDDAPLTSKLIAGSTIFLTIGVIYFGRMLPFIGNSF